MIYFDIFTISPSDCEQNRRQHQNYFKMARNKTSDTDSTMLASETFDRILSIVQHSNLNFSLQVSPFSAHISLKKSLVQDRSGSFRFPPEPSTDNKNFKEVIAALVAENNKLENAVKSLGHDLVAAREDCEVANNRIKFLEDQLEENALKRKTENEIDKKDMEKKETKIRNLEVHVCKLEEEKKSLEIELHHNKEDISKQNDEKARDISNLEKKLEELENENMKLKDVLYGCCECGMFTCECDDAATEENIRNPPPSAQPSSTSATSSKAPAPQNLSTGSGSYPPWTPPPTPPCTDCGGVNFGPSPGSLCFACIPPLECKPLPSCSPSRTPPGTPPSLQRLDTLSRTSQTR